MTALSRNKPRAIQTDNANGLPLAAGAMLYEGSAVGRAAGAEGVRALVAGDVFVGFADTRCDNRAGALGAQTARLVSRGEVELVVAGAVASSLGASVYATDDDTFTISPGASVIGTVKRVPSAGRAIVAFDALLPSLTSAELPAVRSTLPGALSLVVVADSIQGQSLDTPNSTYGATTGKGSYRDSSNVKTTGVSDIYAENPVRLKFRAAHNLVTGDEGTLRDMASGHPLSYLRAQCTVINSTEITLQGVDGTSVPTLTSAAAATDAMFVVDQAWGNYGPLSWALHEAGYPFDRVDCVVLPGGTSAQVLAQAQARWPSGAPTYYTHGLLHVGRNDSAIDTASSAALLSMMLARCATVLVVLPFPDDNWATPANDAAAAKIAAISAYWYAAQAANPRVQVCDLFGAFSNPAATLQASVDAYIASDGTHPQANGALVAGVRMAEDLFRPFRGPRRALSRVGAGGANLLTGGRFTGAAGTVGSGVSGTVATGWTVGGRSSANVTGGYVQVCQTPAVRRKHSTAVAAGDILDIGDGWWYLVKTAGTTDSSLPAGYASATLFDSGTGVTDGTAVAFRIPKFTDSLDYVRWQLLDVRLSSDGGNEHISFYQSLALPGSVVEGDRLRGQVDVVEAGGFAAYVTARLSCVSGSSAQLARAHGLAPNNRLTQRPALPVRPRVIQTPPVRVPNATATIELRITVSPTIDGAQVFVSLPTAEEV